MIRNLAQNRLVRVLSGAVMSQAMLSAANFAVGLVLIRYTSDQTYGYYVLAFYALALLTTVQGAWLSGPLSVLSAKKSEDERHRMIGSIRSQQEGFLRLLAFLGCTGPLVAWALGWLPRVDALVMAATALAGWTALSREFMRTVAMIYSRPQALLGGDLSYVLALVSVVGLAAAVGEPAAAPVAVLALALAGFAALQFFSRSLGRSHGWAELDTAHAARWWGEMRSFGLWATVGAVIYWTFSQGYNYLLAAKLDLAAVAAINAARLLLMPTYLLTTGVKGMLLPQSARWLEEQGFAALLRRQALIIAVLSVLFAAYFVFLWLTHEWIFREVMRREELSDTVFLLAGWAVLSSLNLVRDMFQNALLALERLKRLAWLSAASTTTAIAVLWWALDAYGVRGAMMGLIAGELVNTGGVLLLCAWELFRKPPQSPPRPTASDSAASTM